MIGLPGTKGTYWTGEDNFCDFRPPKINKIKQYLNLLKRKYYDTARKIKACEVLK